MSTRRVRTVALHMVAAGAPAAPAQRGVRTPTEEAALFEVPDFTSSWDDLLEGVGSPAEWAGRREELRCRYLRLLRDEEAPERVELAVRVEEDVEVEGLYRRQLISYAVAVNERAHAYLGLPLGRGGGAEKLPAIVALHGTYAEGLEQAAGMVAAEGQDPGSPADKGYLDHLCRRGYVVIAPEHFVSCFREPAAGPCARSPFCALALPHPFSSRSDLDAFC